MSRHLPRRVGKLPIISVLFGLIILFSIIEVILSSLFKVKVFVFDSSDSRCPFQHG